MTAVVNRTDIESRYSCGREHVTYGTVQNKRCRFKLSLRNASPRNQKAETKIGLGYSSSSPVRGCVTSLYGPISNNCITIRATTLE